jgi:hypothetical protein
MMPKLPLKPGLVRQLENACRNTDARHRDISKQYGVSLGCLHDYAMRLGWRLPTGPQNPRYSAEVWAEIESLCRTTTGAIGRSAAALACHIPGFTRKRWAGDPLFTGDETATRDTKMAKK